MASSTEDYGRPQAAVPPAWLRKGLDQRAAAKANKMLENMDVAFRMQNKKQSQFRSKWYSPHAIGADVGFDTENQFLNSDGSPMSKEQIEAESELFEVW